MPTDLLGSTVEPLDQTSSVSNAINSANNSIGLIGSTIMKTVESIAINSNSATTQSNQQQSQLEADAYDIANAGAIADATKNAATDTTMAGYYKDAVFPYLTVQDFITPSQGRDIQTGVHNSKTLGAMPIFAGGQAGVLPFAAFAKRRSVLQDLLVRASIPKAEDKLLYERPKPIEVKAFEQPYHNMFFSVLSAYEKRAAPFGTKGYNALQNSSTKLGQNLNKDLEQVAVLGREINSAYTMADEIVKDYESKEKYVPESSYRAARKILEGAGDFVGNKLMIDDIGSLNETIGKLKSAPSFTSIVDTYRSKLEKTIEQTIENETTKSDGGQEWTVERREEYKNEQVELMIDNIVATSPHFYSGKGDRTNASFTRKDLEDYFASTLGYTKTSEKQVRSGQSVTKVVVNNNEKPDKVESFPQTVVNGVNSFLANGMLRSDDEKNFIEKTAAGARIMINGVESIVPLSDYQTIMESTAIIIGGGRNADDVKDFMLNNTNNSTYYSQIRDNLSDANIPSALKPLGAMEVNSTSAKADWAATFYTAGVPVNGDGKDRWIDVWFDYNYNVRTENIKFFKLKNQNESFNGVLLPKGEMNVIMTKGNWFASPKAKSAIASSTEYETKKGLEYRIDESGQFYDIIVTATGKPYTTKVSTPVKGDSNKTSLVPVKVPKSDVEALIDFKYQQGVSAVNQTKALGAVIKSELTTHNGTKWYANVNLSGRNSDKNLLEYLDEERLIDISGFSKEVIIPKIGEIVNAVSKKNFPNDPDRKVVITNDPILLKGNSKLYLSVTDLVKLLQQKINE
jgi:hypothetical protein